MVDSAKRVISGTYGEIWVNGEKLAEAYGLQAKVNYKKEEVAICGNIISDTKLVSATGTGSLKLHKVNSRMAKLIGEDLLQGRDTRCTIISKLADPDSYGSERIALYNVSFDDLTLADWEAGALGKTECPFTFTRHEYLDRIGV